MPSGFRKHSSLLVVEIPTMRIYWRWLYSCGSQYAPMIAILKNLNLELFTTKALLRELGAIR
jgi:hypothetical protein